jgi:hypothetical protein
LCVAASLSLLVFRRFEKLPLFAALLIHFFVCIAMMVLYVFQGSFYMDVHPNAYRDAVRTIFYIYPVVIVGGLLIDGIKTARANFILKKNRQ